MECRPFLSIVTRCYKRPKMLYRCLESISKQTDGDYENVIIVDTVGIRSMPGEWHKQGEHLHKYANRIHGEYVYMLDDDDYLVNFDFVKELKIICMERKPDVVLVKMSRPWLHQVLPDDSVWEKKPIMDHIGTPCFIVKRELWMDYVSNYFKGDAADFFFIDAIFKTNPKIYWWDKVITCVPQVGQGITEI